MNWYKKAQQDFQNQPKNWQGTTLYHGTSKEGAQDILTNGIDNAKSTKGYFGRGFYMAEDRNLAQSNYADFADDEEPGVVLKIKINENANILDLRSPKHWDIYQKVTQKGRLVPRDDFDQIMTRNGIDGIYDNSFGGVVIFNPKRVEVLGISESENKNELV